MFDYFPRPPSIGTGGAAVADFYILYHVFHKKRYIVTFVELNL